MHVICALVKKKKKMFLFIFVFPVFRYNRLGDKPWSLVFIPLQGAKQILSVDVPVKIFKIFLNDDYTYWYNRYFYIHVFLSFAAIKIFVTRIMKLFEKNVTLHNYHNKYLK